MMSTRYGDLRSIAAKSNGACHLCGDRINLRYYGRTGLYGKRTVTVDHVEPQSLGGSDDPENLRIAHGTCNSFRGVGSIELARLLLGGPVEEPLARRSVRVRSKALPKRSQINRTTENAETQWGTVGLLAFGAGVVGAKPNAAGGQQFNWKAAATAFLAFGALAALAG